MFSHKSELIWYFNYNTKKIKELTEWHNKNWNDNQFFGALLICKYNKYYKKNIS